MNAALAEAPTPNFVLANYRRALAALRVVERTPRAATTDPASPYFGLAEHELVKDLRATREELDQQVVMMLVASAEAALMRDYHRRLARREKTGVRLAMKDLPVDTRDGVKLGPLLRIWYEQTGNTKELTRMRLLVSHRHWLAHGRRWADKSGIRPDPAEAAGIIREFFLRLPDFPAVELPGS